MPRTSVPADICLCPDLHLSASDAAICRVAVVVYLVVAVVRRVVAIVVWFKRMASLAGTQ
jgi:hypothetical protein